MPPVVIDRCVKKVMKSGKPESQAYAICSKSTGYKKAKKGKWVKRNEAVTFESIVLQALNEFKNR